MKRSPPFEGEFVMVFRVVTIKQYKKEVGDIKRERICVDHGLIRVGSGI